MYNIYIYADISMHMCIVQQLYKPIQGLLVLVLWTLWDRRLPWKMTRSGLKSSTAAFWSPGLLLTNLI